MGLALRNRNHIRHLMKGVIAALLLAAATPAMADPILAPDRITDRDLTIWFGTLSVVGAPASSQDFLSLDDKISNVVQFVIQNDLTIDARVRNLPDSVVNPAQNAVDWVLGVNPAPLNLPAQQNLLDMFASAVAGLESAFGPGSFTLTTSGSANRDYILADVTTIEFAPIFVGNSDAPFLFGNDGDEVQISNKWIANAHFFEQNATWTASSINSVPEPASLSLLLIGLATIGLSVRRKRP